VPPCHLWRTEMTTTQPWRDSSIRLHLQIHSFVKGKKNKHKQLFLLILSCCLRIQLNSVGPISRELTWTRTQTLSTTQYKPPTFSCSKAGLSVRLSVYPAQKKLAPVCDSLIAHKFAGRMTSLTSISWSRNMSTWTVSQMVQHRPIGVLIVSNW